MFNFSLDVIGSYILKIGEIWLKVDESLQSITSTSDEAKASEFHFVKFETGERGPKLDLFTIQVRAGSGHKSQIRFLSLPGSKLPVKLEKIVNISTSVFYLSQVDTEKPVSLAAEVVLDGPYLVCRRETYWFLSWRPLFLATDKYSSGQTFVTGRHRRTEPDVHTQLLLIKPSGFPDDHNTTAMNTVQ